MPKIPAFLISILLLSACTSKHQTGYSYAIRDFRDSVRPFLVSVVATGYVTSQDPEEMKKFSAAELEKLANAENPILRATALREMEERDSISDFYIVMNHLDDTAIVATDAGEYGIWYKQVSDYMLQYANWKTTEERNKTVDAVLTRHNYLQSAYSILPQWKTDEKYYPYIKAMATRPRRLSKYGEYELGFADIEQALFGLAKFRKKEDIPIIKQKLQSQIWDLSYVTFSLLKEYPDTAYFDLLQYYHRRSFYKFTGNRLGDFTGYAVGKADPEDFINALLAQKTDRSARLLDTIVTNLKRKSQFPDREYVCAEVITGIWHNPCPAYNFLKQKYRDTIRIGKTEHLEPIEPDTTAILSQFRRNLIRWNTN